MSQDREVAAALDRIAAGEPVAEVADDYGVKRVFLEALVAAKPGVVTGMAQVLADLRSRLDFAEATAQVERDAAEDLAMRLTAAEEENEALRAVNDAYTNRDVRHTTFTAHTQEATE